MEFNKEAVAETAKAATTDTLIRSLDILAKQNTDDARLRAGVITEELARRAEEDIETNGPWV